MSVNIKPETPPRPFRVSGLVPSDREPPLHDQVQRLLQQTRRMVYPANLSMIEALNFITKHGRPAERIRARRLRAQLRRRAELAPTET